MSLLLTIHLFLSQWYASWQAAEIHSHTLAPHKLINTNSKPHKVCPQMQACLQWDSPCQVGILVDEWQPEMPGGCPGMATCAHCHDKTCVQAWIQTCVKLCTWPITCFVYPTQCIHAVDHKDLKMKPGVHVYPTSVAGCMNIPFLWWHWLSFCVLVWWAGWTSSCHHCTCHHCAGNYCAFPWQVSSLVPKQVMETAQESVSQYQALNAWELHQAAGVLHILVCT